MKKNILLLITSLLFFIADEVQALELCVEGKNCLNGTNFYAKIFGGANFLQDTEITKNKSSYKPGYVIAGLLGYSWHYGLRLEAEYAYRRNAIRKIDFFIEGSSRHGHVRSSSYMANLLWDLPLSSWGCTCWGIQPFIGAGLGYDYQKMHATNSRVIFNQKWNHFSWQLMAGGAYSIYCNTELTLEYQFHQDGSHFNNHTLGVGLVYKFTFLR